MQYKKIILIFFLIIFSTNIFCYTNDEIINKTKELNLIDTLNNTENISSASKIIYNKNDFWVLETNSKDILILKDTNINSEIKKEDYKNILKTYLFFSKINSINLNNSAYYFNTFPSIINNFNYNLELMKRELAKEDSNVILINNFTNIQTNAINLGKSTKELTLNLLNLDANYKINSYDNYQEIISINKEIIKLDSEIINGIAKLKDSILILKISLMDSNASTELKYNIGNSGLILPADFDNIPQQLATIRETTLKINNSEEYSNNLNNLELLYNNYDNRVKRKVFIDAILKEDELISKNTKYNNASTLFNYIIQNKNNFQSYDEIVKFLEDYNKMYNYLDSREYSKAKTQILPLITIALSINEKGFITNTNNNNVILDSNYNEEEEKSKPLYLYVALGLGLTLIVVIVINLIKKYKNKNKEENEIKFDFEG